MDHGAGPRGVGCDPRRAARSVGIGRTPHPGHRRPRSEAAFPDRRQRSVLRLGRCVYDRRRRGPCAEASRCGSSPSSGPASAARQVGISENARRGRRRRPRRDDPSCSSLCSECPIRTSGSKSSSRKVFGRTSWRSTATRSSIGSISVLVSRNGSRSALVSGPVAFRTIAKVFDEWSLATAPPLSTDLLAADRDEEATAVLRWMNVPAPLQKKAAKSRP